MERIKTTQERTRTIGLDYLTMPGNLKMKLKQSTSVDHIAVQQVMSLTLLNGTSTQTGHIVPGYPGRETDLGV